MPIPDHIDLYHLHQEAEPSDRTALQSVVDHIEAEIARLNALEEHIMCEYGPEDERLQVGQYLLVGTVFYRHLVLEPFWRVSNLHLIDTLMTLNPNHNL